MINSVIRSGLILALLLGSGVLRAESAYLLKEGDLISISVWGEDKLNQDIRVLPDGSISFPLAGRLVVRNMSAPQVEQALVDALAEFVPDASVSVLIRDVEGNRVFTLGKVKVPGAIVMTAPLTVTQALSLAGGLDTFANPNGIRILRQNGDSESAQLAVRYSDIMSGRDVSTNYVLHAGDTILVP